MEYVKGISMIVGWLVGWFLGSYLFLSMLAGDLWAGVALVVLALVVAVLSDKWELV